MKIQLEKYGLVISDQEIGKEIYSEITKILKSNPKCIVDFQNIKSMATFNAKQIFGKLYLDLGAVVFFDKIEIKNATDDLKLIIRLGIQSAIEDEE